MQTSNNIICSCCLTQIPLIINCPTHRLSAHQITYDNAEKSLVPFMRSIKSELSLNNVFQNASKLTHDHILYSFNMSVSLLFFFMNYLFGDNGFKVSQVYQSKSLHQARNMRVINKN